LKIAVYCEPDSAIWITALERALPEARIDRWSAALGAEADYAVVWRPSADVLPGLARVKAIFNLGAGIDAIPDLQSIPRGVRLVRLDDAGMTEQMSEYVVHAVLRCYREFDVYAGQQKEALWRPRSRLPKPEFIVGVLGAGVLGSAVAKSLSSLGFPVRAWSRTPKQLAGIECFAGAEALGRFLGATRFLVCVLPLTAETRDFLNRARLSLLPPGAYLVNVARGALVVDDDLLSLLDSGHLAGAMLDVFRDEPLPPRHPFWHHPRVVVTPHVSAVTLVKDSVEQIAAKIRHLESGLPITGVVDREQGY
jgi:glyoxylate/hydroxypyruvate reductase A